MKRLAIVISLIGILFCFCTSALAQNIYELRKLTEDDWLAMTTEERLRSLGAATRHEVNKTFLGDFGKYHDMYRKWGYEFYEMEDRYENLAFRGYEQYNVIEERRRRWSYNEFGDRITRMRHSANIWREIYSGDNTYKMFIPFDYINTTGIETGYTDGVWVAREGTDDWALSVTGAGALRTKFTPLTLSLPSIDGMSIDLQSANSQLKIINSAYMGHTGNRGSLNPSDDLYRRGGVMLRGGHFRRKFGLLTLGATYANTYGVQGNRERGHEWRGTVTTDTPTPVMVAVRFLDDSPQDGRGGPIIYDVKLKIDGKIRSDIIPQIVRSDSRLGRTSAITDKLDSAYLEPTSSLGIGPPSLDHYNIQARIPKYTDMFYLNDLIKGFNSNSIETKFSNELADAYYSIVEQGGKPIRADGYESVVYYFDLVSITNKVHRIESVVTVANDYKIQTAMIYTMETVGGHDTSGKEKSWYDSTYWRTAAQSDGNIKDGSNVKTLSVDFGFQVASIIYGIDAEFNYFGFKIKGEYVNNSTHHMFAEGAPGQGPPSNIVSNMAPRSGHRWSVNDNAYYIIAEKSWERFGFAAEKFKMGKFYQPYFDFFYPAGSEADWRYGVMARNRMTRVTLIEDNDDDDFYPDTMAVRRTFGYRIFEQEDPDGVFPGNDDDNDGLPDNNRNNNGTPDYDEPFFMFDVDSDEFVFGNDYNNNTIPDFREDDMKLDTPYQLDRQGHHWFVRYTPVRSVEIRAGSSRQKGVGSSGMEFDDYLKFILNYNVFDVGKLYAEYRYEKIQDNVRDPYVQVNKSMTENYLMPGIHATLGRYERELYFDELEYRNSIVNRLFLDSKIRAIPSITLENHIKYERNDQVEGRMYDFTYQPNDILSTIAMINKVVYTKRVGNWIFSPGLKYRFYKKVRSQSLLPLNHFLMRIPLIHFKYIISPDTDVMLGLQGIPRLNLSYRDYVQTQNDYREKTYTLQLQNKTTYFGYNIWASAGATLNHKMYDEEYRKFEEYKSTETFLKVSLGW